MNCNVKKEDEFTTQVELSIVIKLVSPYLSLCSSSVTQSDHISTC